MQPDERERKRETIRRGLRHARERRTETEIFLPRLEERQVFERSSRFPTANSCIGATNFDTRGRNESASAIRASRASASISGDSITGETAGNHDAQSPLTSLFHVLGGARMLRWFIQLAFPPRGNSASVAPLFGLRA